MRRFFPFTLALAALLTASAAVPPPAKAASRDYTRIASRLTEAVVTSKQMTTDRDLYDAVFHRDPMRPLIDAQGDSISPTGLKGGFSVAGIIWSDDHPLVVIDDDLFGVGETLGPYTITAIKPDGLIAKHCNKNEEIWIPLDR